MKIFSIKEKTIVHSLYLLLILSFIFVFYGNFFGIDLTDEGFAILGYFPEQELGINFTHYQLLIRRFFPAGMSFVMSRQLRLGMILLSNILLLYSIYHSKLKKHFNYLILLFGATTLISLGTGIQTLSYNALNQFLITIYIVFFIQYLEKLKNKNDSQTFIWLVLSTIFLSIIYLVRLPSFLIYIPLHFILVFVLGILHKKELITIFKHLIISFLSVLLMMWILGSTVVSFSIVFNEVMTFENLSSKQSYGHGIGLVIRYVFDFILKCISLFFAAIAYLALNKYFKKIKNSVVEFFLQLFLLFSVILIIISHPISVGSVFVFLFFILIISFYNNKKDTIDFYKERTFLITAFIFPLFAISSTLGSNVWIINLLLFYLSVWAVGLTFFINKNNLKLFKNATYILVIIAVLKVLFTGFINPHRQGSLLDKHHKFEIGSRGSILLDSEMFNYVTEIRNYLDSEKLLDNPIIAVSRLPGLVYLLDSTMPGSMNFTDAYWNIFCENLDSNKKIKPVIIFRGNIPNELINCLAENNINLENDYILGNVIETGVNIYQIPTYIYKYNK